MYSVHVRMCTNISLRRSLLFSISHDIRLSTLSRNSISLKIYLCVWVQSFYTPAGALWFDFYHQKSVLSASGRFVLERATRYRNRLHAFTKNRSNRICNIIISTSYIPPFGLFDVDVLNPNFPLKLTDTHTHTYIRILCIRSIFTYCIILYGRRLVDCIGVSRAHRLLPLQQAQVVWISTI